MNIEMATVRAKFDEREFLVTESSANIKQPPAVGSPLFPYLNILRQAGWKAVRGRFDGWTVLLDLEKSKETEDTGSTYMLLMLYQVPDPEVLLSEVAGLQTKFFNELQELRVKQGWEIITRPKHLSSIKGIWTVSIWAKHEPDKQ